jgi:hypothetical protein
MKIYTEINYKWLDGGLVETDSKSFEYEGYLTLCGPGGGGGNPNQSFLDQIAAKTTAVVEDPVGSAKAGLDTAVTTVVDNSPLVAVEVAGDNLQTLVENNPIGTEGLGMNSGMATTLGDVGGMINEGITTGTDALIRDDWESGINTSIADGMDGIRYNTEIAANAWDVVQDRLHGFSEDVLEFMAPGSTGGGDKVDDPTNIKSNNQGLKNKAKANLKVNKSKGRARKSLRVG